MSFLLPEHIDPKHCVVTQRYAVYTPPIHEMIGHIGDWIDQRQPGGYIYGPSRFGKTRCVRWYVEKDLEERFHSAVPLVIWPHRPDTYTSEAGFWHQILLASGFAFAMPSKPPTKSQAMHHCTERFIAIANNADRNYVVLLIDEAQGLTYREWHWLVGLQNVLDYRGYLLSVFSVGSHQMNYQYEYMAATGSAHVAARFMAAHARFHGLHSVDEVEFVLKGYDIYSEWPEGSGTTYLEYFSPSDFKAGRRLSECREPLWKALVELSPESSKRHLEFPMHHVARTIEAVLFTLACGVDWEIATSFESWLKELAKTNFSDHMRIISTE